MGPLIITGMHRSGTSAAARLLQSAGLHLGERLLGPSPSNLRGHFENLDFLDFHQRVLRARGEDESGWTWSGQLAFTEPEREEARGLAAANATASAWGWKDPRTVLFLRDWAALLPEAAFLFVCRSPWEVIDSLYRRAGEHDEAFLRDPALAVDVWMHYARLMVGFLDEQPGRCLLTGVHTASRHPAMLVATLNERFGLGLGHPDEALFEHPLLRSMPEPGHRFQTVQRYRPQALDLYRDLLRRCLTPLDPADARWLERPLPVPDERWPFREWLDLRVSEKARMGLQADVESAQGRLLGAQAGLAEAQTRLVEAEAARTAVESELSEARENTERLRAKAERTASKLKAARAEVERRRGEARAASEEAERAAFELRTTRSELQRSQYYLDAAMRNATTERERFLAEAAGLRGALEAVEKEGVTATLGRLRSKLFRAVLLTVPSGLRSRVRPWLPRRRAPSAPVAMAALSVEQFWKRLEPALTRHGHAVTDAPPCLSILTPTLNTPLAWFLDTVASVLAQTSSAWEWCVVDDGSTSGEIRAVLTVLSKKVPRIKVALAERGGISAATNRALDLAGAEYVCFLDHDDLLAPTAVAEMLAKLAGGWDAVYSDEDKIDAAGEVHREPFHKPDWSPEYLRGVMYVGHLLAVRRELAVRLGGLDGAFDGVQDFEFALRLSETTARVGHLPRILYHWRQGTGSLAADPHAKPGIEALQRAAVNAHLKRVGLAASAEDGLGPHRVRIVPRPRERHPRVSIIIPTRDAPGFLERCLGSIYALTAYPNYEVVLVDNETRDPQALDIMKSFPVKRVPFPNPFNFSRANNLGAARAEGDFLLFLNNDTEIVARDWIDHLVYYAEQPDAGAVGSLLLYPNRTVQHAGIVLGFRGTADHVMRGMPGTADGYAGSLACAREVSAVTAACMMVGARAFTGVGCFNEHFATHYQDVDLCLRLRAAGRRNIFTPRSVVLHLESATRGSTYDMVDRMLLLDRWEEEISNGDPFYNPNFDLARTDYALRTSG